ncbi:MAG: pyridoxamine 5'-phosphate oxidase family protein [Ktedonobacteraceae bacterium]|nr:pyridoxamine 5'-phosphate oxidase family protein [Ktedonobacteraceae bacterium]
MVVHTPLPAGQEQARTRWNTHASGEAFDCKKSSYLTEQAQKFIVQQGQCVVAGLNGHNELGGLLVLGTPGFVQTPDEHTCLLRLDGDLATSAILLKLHQSFQDGQTARLGLFFICHPTRERLCVHGRAELFTRRSLFRKAIWVRLHVEQSFFHCSKYIKTHIPGLTSLPLVTPQQISQLKQLDDSQLRPLSEPVCAFIAEQLLCFLCTVGRDGQPAINHRGGAAGFLVTLPPDTIAPGGTILLPDYSGNGAFEAIGNIFETRQAALVIPNYSAQLAVCVSGMARILELGDLSPQVAQSCVGAERVVALVVQRVEVQSGNWSAALAYERARAERMLHESK